MISLNPNIQRQIEGNLTPEEQELLKEKPDINQLRSEIKKERELRKEAEKDRDFQMKQNEALIKQYSLKVDSLTTIIAELKGRETEGSGTTGVKDGKRWYKWTDSYGRFHLFAPDIMKSYAEFTYDQHFKLNIVAFRQASSDGALRVQSAHLYEITSAGKVIKEAQIDLSKSNFQFSIQPQQERKARKWMTGLDSQGELLVSYLPINRYHGMLGFGLSGGASTRNSQFVGLTVMGFPPSWYNSGFGVGASVGYSPQNRNSVSWRFQVSWSPLDLFKKKL